MKYLLTLILLLFTVPAVAQTGIYYDMERNGEGITVFNWTNLHKEQVVTFYFYTYDEDNNQRWFFASDAWSGKQSTGKLHITKGVKYPEGVPSDEPFEEDVVIVGVPTEVGDYTLILGEEGGYLLWVEQLEDDVGPVVSPSRPEGIVDDTDYLYDRAWFFTDTLISIGGN